MRPRAPRAAWMDALILPSGVVTLLRVPLGVTFAFVPSRTTQLIVLALAALSDAADGAIARSRHEETRAGAILDPIADKWFGAWVVGSLFAHGTIDASTAAALLLRDVGLAAAMAILFVGAPRAHGPVRAAMLGKITTVVQFVAVAAIVLRLAVASAFVAASAVFGALAAASYFRREIRARRSRVRP